MTRELLAEANRLNHTINELTEQLNLIEEMHHCDNNLIIRCEAVGAITIMGDDELKDDIIDLVLERLSDRREDMEDKLRLL